VGAAVGVMVVAEEARCSWSGVEPKMVSYLSLHRCRSSDGAVKPDVEEEEA